MKKNILRQLFVAFVTIASAITLYMSPVIIQSHNREVLTNQGGYIEHYSKYSSLREIYKNYPCSLYCFPSTEETRRFNILSIFMMGTCMLIFIVLTFLLLYKKTA